MMTFHRSGSVNIWVLLTGFILVALVGMAMDVAYVSVVLNQLQNAADAGALAGAQYLRSDTVQFARQQAWDAAASNAANLRPIHPDSNTSNAAGGDIVIGRYHRASRTFTATLTGANAVKVVTKRPDVSAPPLALAFGPLFRINNLAVRKHAVAMTIDNIGAAMLVLNRDDPRAFRCNGNPIVNVNNGSIHINSEHPNGIRIDGTPAIHASDINVCADSAPFGNSYDGNLNLGAPYMPDPLAYLHNMLPEPGEPLTVPAGSEVTLQPGYYPEGIALTSGTVRLESGVYVLSGNGLKITGGIFIGSNVLIYVTGNNKTEVTLGGNGMIEISPMTSGPYAGVSLFQDPNLRSDASINGSNQMHVSGTLYFPGNLVSLGGTGDAFGSQIIADKIEISGNSEITINYDGRFALPGRSFLVE